jgi:hypothetical protein
MTLRTDIAIALDSLQQLGRHAEFEGLAVHLIRTKLPSLTPSERSHDGGEDAYPLVTSPGGLRVRVAASFDATLSKVRRDAERIRGRSVEIDQLIFVTPRPVRRTEIDKWKPAIKSEFGWDLEVLSREGIVSELERPENHWLLRQYLDMVVATAPTAKAALTRGMAAVASLLPELRRAHRTPEGLVELHLVPVSEERSESIQVGDLPEHLRSGLRIVLRGPPGAGKTCTMIQLLDLLAGEARGVLPVFVSAPDWSISSVELDQFAAGELGLSPDELALLHAEGCLSFLINGWNEVPPEHLAAASAALRTLARRWPRASIVISTRQGEEDPPLSDSTYLEVAELDDDQRIALIRSAGIGEPRELLATIAEHPDLESITRNPLFLTVAVSLSLGGEPLPSSRYALLEASVRALELPEHLLLLRDACGGHHRRYLEAIATEMTSRGTTRLAREDCWSIIGETNRVLQEARLVSTPPEPFAVLRGLVDYHLLISSGGEGIDRVSFPHQLFQDWFTAEGLCRSLCSINGARQLGVLNRIRWDQSLRLLAERSRIKDDCDCFGDWVAEALTLDLVFGARIAGASNDRTWTQVVPELRRAVELFDAEGTAESRAYALEIAIATSRPDFEALAWQRIGSDDESIRFEAYERLAVSELVVLGENWPSRLKSLAVAARSEFAQHVGTYGSASTAIQIAKALSGEQSSTVRGAVIYALDWHRLDGMLLEWVEASSPSLLTQSVFPETLRRIPSRIRLQLSGWFRSVLSDVGDRETREIALWSLATVGDSNAAQDLRQLVQQAPDGPRSTLVSSFVKGDQLSARQRILERIDAGALTASDSELLEAAPDLALSAASSALHNGEVRAETAVIRAAARLEPAAVGALVAQAWYERVEELAAAGQGASHPDARRLELEYLLFDLDDPSRIEGILSLPEVQIARELRERLHVLARSDGGFGTLDEAHRDRLRTAALGWMSLLETWPDDRRDLRTSVALLVASLGDQQDLTQFYEWLLADHAEYREHVLRVGHRRNISGHQLLLINGLLCYPAERVGPLLLELLRDPDYFAEAATGLAKLLRPSPGFHFGDSRRIDLSSGGRPPTATESTYTGAMAAALEAFLAARDPEHPSPPFDHQLISASAALGRIGYMDIVPMIAPLAPLPWLGSSVAGALLELAYNGLILPTEEVLPALQPPLEKILQKGWFTDQEWWSINSWVSLFLCLEDPSAGVELVRRLWGKDHRTRDLIRRMANVVRPEVSRELGRLLADQTVGKDWGTEIVSALANHRTAHADAELLDHLARQLLVERVDYETARSLGIALDAASRRDPAVLNEILKRCEVAESAGARGLLWEIVYRIDDDSARVAACYLLRGDSEGQGHQEEIFEWAFYRKEPAGSGSYTRVPRSANRVREVLYSLVADPVRRRGARKFLVFGEIARAGSGRPEDEPRCPRIEGASLPQNWLLTSLRDERAP